MGGHATRWTGKRSRASAASGWLRSAFLMTAVSLAGVTLGAACSGGDDRLGPPGQSGGTTTGTGVGPACVEGETRDCSVTISEHNGVITCMDGTQACVDGQWTACGGGSRRLMPAPQAEAEADDGLPRPKSLSLPTDCVDNPCDPSCQIFGEDPGPGGITIAGTPPPFDWEVGNINTLDPALSALGTDEPCATAEDCQFDQHCEVASALACAHHPCAQGTATSPVTSPNTGLFTDCSPCVQKVCDQHPECCNATYPGPCEHDVCRTGPALKLGCDPCVDAVCAVAGRRSCCDYTCATNADCTTLFGAGSTCTFNGKCTPVAGSCTNVHPGFTTNIYGECIGNWVGACTTQAISTCGKSCALNRWTTACVGYAEALCGVECEAPWGVNNTCVHSPCYTGDRLAGGCDPLISQVCTAIPTCCTSAWTDACVERYNLVAPADRKCDIKGRCVAYPPGTSNTACPGIDLTVGVPCGGLVPVCNRGQTAVPAGSTLEIVSYPENTNSFPSTDAANVLSACNPAAGPGTPACSMALAQPLAAGDCINVPGCDGLPVRSEIRVNPANTIPECLCGNNWSVYQDEPCESPACVADASVSFVKKVTMFFAIDNSSSMVCTGVPGCPGGVMGPCPSGNAADVISAQRWIPMRNALINFFQDGVSANLDVALRFWPEDAPAACNSSTCGQLGAANGCGQPLLFGTLTEATGAADPHEQALVNALNINVPCGETPTHIALDGATYWASQHKQANPEQEVVVVLVSDGIPNGCNPDWLAISQAAQSAFQTAGVRTYVLGFGEASENFVSQIAQYGGGRGFFLPTGAALQTNFLNALKSIRGDVLPCDVEIPLAGINNAGDIEIVYTDGAGVETSYPDPLADLASCGDGWYYDPVTPSVAKLCPATCAAIQADPDARVEARIQDSMACEDSYTQTTYAQSYHADCPAGTKVQWGFLRWDATTPDDSSVVFTARTAEAELDLPTAMPHTLGTAQAAPLDTQVCTMAGPAPACPVDLYTALGELPDARNDWLQVTMTLNPSSAGNSVPTVHNWEITYSCPYSE